MRNDLLVPLSVTICTALILSACSSFDRAESAAAARRHMVGLTKEQVLICMGPPKQKAKEGITEVWSYASTDGTTTSPGFSQKLISGFTFKDADKQKYFCTVNIVMTNNIVSIVHYNGPRGGLLTQDEQCGYAIEHCVE